MPVNAFVLQIPELDVLLLCIFKHAERGEKKLQSAILPSVSEQNNNVDFKKLKSQEAVLPVQGSTIMFAWGKYKQVWNK